jgi:DNA-binding MarR family transcriptional regulator
MADDRDLTHDERLLWSSLGRLVHTLPRALESDMTRAAGISMTEFAALLALAEAPDRRLRMSALAAAIGVTAPRMTRVVDVLADEGLIERTVDSSDARGSLAVLTDRGVERVRTAGPHHVACARRRVLDHIPVELVPGLAAALEQIVAETAGPRHRSP